jgi:hypothetical protein
VTVEFLLHFVEVAVSLAGSQGSHPSRSRRNYLRKGRVRDRLGYLAARGARYGVRHGTAVRRRLADRATLKIAENDVGVW